MQGDVFQFWNNAQMIYDTMINKTMNGQLLTENEAMTMAELGHMLERYYYLQRLILDKDIHKWEPKDDDDSDGFADAST